MHVRNAEGVIPNVQLDAWHVPPSRLWLHWALIKQSSLLFLGGGTCTPKVKIWKKAQVSPPVRGYTDKLMDWQCQSMLDWHCQSTRVPRDLLNVRECFGRARSAKSSGKTKNNSEKLPGKPEEVRPASLHHHFENTFTNCERRTICAFP